MNVLCARKTLKFQFRIHMPWQHLSLVCEEFGKNKAVGTSDGCSVSLERFCFSALDNGYTIFTQKLEQLVFEQKLFEKRSWLKRRESEFFEDWLMKMGES